MSCALKAVNICTLVFQNMPVKHDCEGLRQTVLKNPESVIKARGVSRSDRVE